MNRLKPGEMILLVVIGLGLLVIGVPMLILGIAGMVSCGDWTGFGFSEVVASLKGGLSQVPSDECSAGSTTNRVVAVTLLVVAVGIIGGAIYGWRRWEQSSRKLMMDVKKREGIAQSHEVKVKAGTKALQSKAREIRPSLKRPKLSEAGRCLGVSQNQQVWTSMEDSVVVLGPPRSGKGFFLIINAILDSPGAVVTTSTRGDNAAATIKLREKVGPVTVFDPQGLSGYKSSLKWSPFHGCADATVARNRASTLMGATGLGGSSNNAEWAQQAEVILMYLLHAAELGKVSVREFAGWGQSPVLAQGAVEILERSPEAVPGWGANLRAAVETDPKMQASKWLGVSGATEGLTIPGVEEALDPKHGDEVFDAEEFIRNNGTLYLLGTKSGGGASAPFLIALMDEVSQTARKMAFGMAKNRLEPPLSLILDEIANIAPWKELPTIMSDGGGVGISTMVVLQSPAQAKAQWGDAAEALLNAAILTIQLGGSTNDAELRKFTELMGKRKVVQKTETTSDQGSSSGRQKADVDVMDVSELRRLPKGWALLLARDARPVILKMRPWLARKDANEVKASIQSFGLSVKDHREESEPVEVSGDELTGTQNRG